MNTAGHNMSLAEAARRFLASLPAEEAGTSQQEIYRFVRWFGQECPLAGLTAPEVANYAQHLSLSDTDYLRKLDLIRTFLIHAKKESWTKNNLATHLKVRKPKTAGVSSGKTRDSIVLTPEGYEELEAELATLKSKRAGAIDEIRLAAADKDFRENAPLEAAREQRSKLEGRIRKLEETIKAATVIAGKHETLTAGIGDTIVLSDLTSGEELRYMLVSPSEVDPTKHKISSVSPLGKAVIGQTQGDTVEVSVPAGKLRYQIQRIER